MKFLVLIITFYIQNSKGIITHSFFREIRAPFLDIRRVFGGSAASISDYPAVCLLADENKITRCTGTIITPSFVITAAHCIIPNLRYIYYNSDYPMTSGTSVTILRAYKHTGFYYVTADEGQGVDITHLYNDIGLLESKQQMSLPTVFMEPIIALNNERYAMDTEVDVIGFGGTNIEQLTSDHLLRVKLLLTPCDRPTWYFCNCVRSPPGVESKGVCTGDSGGPVLLNGKMIGVTSMGPTVCSSDAYPPSTATSVFTVITRYIDVINNTIYRRMNMLESSAGASGCVGGGVAGTTFAAALQYLMHSQCLITEPWPPQANLPNGTTVDIIIVGAGTAGSALAARLAETNLTVLLLEAGGDPPVESIIPGFKSSLLRGPYDWNFTTTDDQYSSQELASHRQRLRTARLLGGSGSINGMIYARAFPADFDQWADILGDSSWNWNNVLPYFKKTEMMTDKTVLNFHPSLKYHGYDGDIEVAGLDTENYDTIKLLEAFDELGINIVEDRNNPERIGAYHLSFTIKDGKRQSSLTAMLNKVVNKGNLYVMKNAFVTKILIKDSTAYGVKVKIGDEEREIYANKEVVVSAGVYNTPKLLMLSGIGPKWHLQQFDVDVVKDLPVGNNLQDHLNSRTFLAAESGACDYDEKARYFEVVKYLYNRTGMYSIPSGIGLDYSLKGSPALHVPDFGVFPTCVPKDSNYLQECLQSLDFTRDMCLYLDTLNKRYELFPFSVILRKPKSRGTVRLASADPLDKPIIQTGAFTNAEDVEGFPEVFEVVWSLTNTSYFKSKKAFVVDLGLKSCEGLDWPEDAKCAARSLAMSDAHAVGTAAMGAVLDTRLRVRGVRGLRVVDASAMPTVPRANTNSIVIMVAEKAADFIKTEYC